VPAVKVGGLVAFFDRDLRPPGLVTVRGSWGRKPLKSRGAPRFRFAGSLPAGERQRVRNFLMEHLR
jgi:hypothetical protein